MGSTYNCADIHLCFNQGLDAFFWKKKVHFSKEGGSFSEKTVQKR